MSIIKTFNFKKKYFDQIKEYNFGKNWPVVYIIEDKKEAYIGQTTNAFYRCKQHYETEERKKLNSIHIITDEEFNVSANFDIESWLIQYFSGDGKYLVQNKTEGLRNHNYYDKAKYQAKFEIIWEELRHKKIVDNSLIDIKNSDLFKYSPYKTLTENQIAIVNKIFFELRKNLFTEKTFIIEGVAGTGKTIIASFLLKYLKEKEETKNLEIGLVLPMSPIRSTIKKVFSKIKGVKSSMIIGPTDIFKKSYDVLIIDEAHRLHKARNITNMGSHYKYNRVIGIDEKKGTELDWAIKRSKIQILFYDKNQRVHPSCVSDDDFQNHRNAKIFRLKEQMRVEGGEEYINFIDDVFSISPKERHFEDNYEFKIYDNLSEMIFDIKEKNKLVGLSRILAGYAWPWKTKNQKDISGYDIEIGNVRLKWNSKIKNWINSPNSINEVGCIHTIQGYGLNYAGVIIGPELYFDPAEQKIKIDRNKYFDINGKRGVTDLKELELYIFNIYKTLLTRGIKGTYIYVVDRNLKEYFKKARSLIF